MSNPSLLFSLVKTMNVAFGNAEGNPRDLQATPVKNEDGNAESVYNELAWERVQKQCENIGGKLDRSRTLGLGNTENVSMGEINGEVLELLEAIERKDIDGVRDALCDIMVFALGAYHIMGYDADADMNAVVEGVMTRFCRNDNEVEQTLQKWADKGITKLAVHGSFPYCYVKATADQVAFNGEQVPKGKFLKSVSYRDTIFPPAPVRGIVARKFMGMPGNK